MRDRNERGDVAAHRGRHRMLYVAYAHEVLLSGMASGLGYGCLILDQGPPKSAAALVKIREMAFADAFGSADYHGADAPDGASTVILFWSELGAA